MAYQLSDLRTKVQNKLDNDTFSTTKLDQFLNDTNRAIVNAHTWPFMETTANFTGVVGQASIGSLPSDFQVAVNLRITSPDGSAKLIPYAEYQEFNRAYPDPSSATNSQPILWYTFAGVINVYPAPEQAYTFSLNYYKDPTTLTATTDVPDVPAEFEELMVLGAYKRSLEHEDNFDQAQIIGLQFDDLLEKMVIRLTNRQVGAVIPMRSGRRRSVGTFISRWER